MSSEALISRDDLTVVTAVSRLDVFQQRLMSSPCLQPGGLRLMAFFNCSSAAQAFNAAVDSGLKTRWLVWVHQDVVLPPGWEVQFMGAVKAAEKRFSDLAVVGVYGVRGAGEQAIKAGHVRDRGALLRERADLPCAVDSLDELLLATKVEAGLRLDPDLGFDFYATDLVLQAQSRGLSAAVVDACCEHWSDTPRAGSVPASTLRRIAESARWFEHKWAARLPITTPCFDIRQRGDVDRFLAAHALARDDRN